MYQDASNPLIHAVFVIYNLWISSIDNKSPRHRLIFFFSVGEKLVSEQVYSHHGPRDVGSSTFLLLFGHAMRQGGARVR
jgi:hypothetical protein